MKKLLVILALFCNIVKAQTTDSVVTNHGVIVPFTHYVLPLTATKYFTGFGTWGSLPDSIRTYISYTGENYLAYNNSTGVLTGSAVNLSTSNATGVAPIARGGTNNGSLSVTNGNLLYTDGSKVVGLGVGTAGQHLLGGTVPHWGDTAVAGGGGGGGAADSAYFWNITGNANTDTTSNYIGTKNGKFLRIKTNGILRADFDTSGNLLFGNMAGTAVSNPPYISMGGKYGNSAFGSTNNLKYRLTDAVGLISGIGASTGYMEFQVQGSAGFGFSINHTTTKYLDITTSQVQSTVPFVSYVASTTKNGFLTFGTFGATQNSGIGNSAASAADLSIFAGFTRNILFGNDKDASTITTANAALWISGTGNFTSGTATENTAAKWNTVSTTQGVLIPRMTTTQRDAILGKLVSGAITPGTGGTPGTYTSQSLTGGSGSGAVATITVNGSGVVSVVTITTAGQGYLVGDVLTASPGSVSGFQWTVGAVSNGLGLQVYNTTIGAVNTNNINNSYQGDFIVSSAGTLTLRYGVDYVFTGTTSTYTLPAISANLLGRENGIKIKNRGSGTITLNTATGSTLYTTSAVSTINIVAGAACELMPDGTYNLVMFNQ